ncbi:alpha-(1,3)-fucosyltransferase C [Glossina fuscipes fuscipes]
MIIYQCKKPKLIIILCLLVFVGLSICIYIDYILPEFYQYHLVRSYANNNNNNNNNADGSIQTRTPIILLWNDFFGDSRWSLRKDDLIPSHLRNQLKCPVYECVITNRREYLPALELYDAVVFHVAQPRSIIKSVPSRRSSKQLYIFALMEPPAETKHILRNENGFYNLTMSYRLDSDILWPYKWIMDKETEMRVAPAEFPQWRKQFVHENDDDFLKRLWPQKVKFSAWFVSHCNTLSEREELIKQLQQYIDIDIYGKCGNYSCPRSSTDCNRLLDEKYKFYFSFENSVCVDYVTEKLYNIMEYNVIPVVYGGANYTRFAPPHSYINAEDFENPKALADYLLYLSQKPDAYMRYFWWRHYYKLINYSPFCDICKKLHEPNYHLKIQIYENIEKWWLGNMCRFKMRIKF